MTLHLAKHLVRANLTRSIFLTSPSMQQQLQKCSKKPKLPANIIRLQKLFQEKNDLPVFLKGGPTDKMLYYTTLGLSGLGLIMNFALFAGYIID